MRKIAILLGLVVTLCLESEKLSAGVIDVLTLDESRVGTSTNSNGSINFNFASGDGFSVARNALLDVANFGSGGVVSDSVSISTSVPEITAATLVGVDVLVLPRVALSVAEQNVVKSFLMQGGGLVAFGNGSGGAYSELLGTSAGSAYTVGSANVAGSSPVSTGPFGNIGGVSVGAGFSVSLDGLGSDAASLLVGTGGEVIGATFSVGNGRAAIFGDEEVFLSKTVSGIAAAKLSSGNNNYKLFLNTFEYVAPSSSFQYDPVPEPSSVAVFGMAAIVGVAGVRRRRRS